jgi:DNA-binding winged helix-turn-helix (wHTH) protein
VSRQMKYPCCGQDVAGNQVIVDGKTVSSREQTIMFFSQQTAKLFGLMMEWSPVWVMKEEITEYLWPGEPSPGRRGADIKILVHKIRRGLAGTNLIVENKHGKGYRLIRLRPSATDAATAAREEGAIDLRELVPAAEEVE